MNDLLFYALLAALLYYFFVYLPSQKKVSHPILTQSQSTQTAPTLNEPITVQLPSAQFVPDPDEVKKLQKDIQQKEKTIIGLNASYDKLEREKDKQIQRITELLNKSETQIKELQTQIRELAKRPIKPTNSKGTQTDELTATLDNLIKDIQDLNNEL